MARQAERTHQIDVTPHLQEAVRQGELDNQWLQEHPEALEPFRGQWVVVYKQQVIAHAADGREAARAANARDYPGSTIFYVPTREEAQAVRIL